ncbi:MAG: TRAP transporter small permease [Ketobacteraceae bacterium]|nr:TRAP transporter small permease [Ketobacteraceae bacterium]
MAIITQITGKWVTLCQWINNAAVIPGLLLIVLADIAARTIWQAPIPWSQEVVGLLILVLFFTGLPVITARSEWLAVDFLGRWRNNILQRSLPVLFRVAVGLFFLIIAAGGAYATREMLLYKETSLILAIPHWPLAMLMCLSGLLSALIVAVQPGAGPHRPGASPPRMPPGNQPGKKVH